MSTALVLSLAALFSACRVIAKSSGAHLSSLGIPAADFTITTGDVPWDVTQRSRVMKTIECLIYGVLDNLGIPRFSVPAEYTAAILVMFVAPANLMVACRWVEATPAVDALAVESQTATAEKVTAPRLFALCIEALNDHVQISAYQARFTSRTGLKLSEVSRETSKHKA